MLTLRKDALAAYTLLAIIALLLVGGYAFHAIQALMPAGDLQAKYGAEQVFYLALLFALALAIFALVLIRRSRLIYRELDRIIALTQSGFAHPADGLHRLGTLGNRIALLVEQLSDLNNKRALKISALSNLIAFLIDNMDLNVLILDRRGEITHCSKKVLRRLETEKGELIGHLANEVIQGLTYEDVVAELEQLRKAATRTGLDTGKRSYSGDFIFYPIFNADNALASVVCILENDAIVDELAKKTEHVTAEEGHRAKRLLRSLRNRAKR